MSSKCNRCNQTKPIDLFKSKSNRLLKRCKTCRDQIAEYGRVYRMNALSVEIPAEMVGKSKRCKTCTNTRPNDLFLSSTGRMLSTCRLCLDRTAMYRQKSVNRHVEVGNRVCIKCTHELPEDKFDAQTKSCRDCSKYTNSHSVLIHQKQRLDIERIKIEMGGRCMDCNERDPRLLQFDHRDPSDKVANVTNLFGQRLVTEAAKCDLVCLRCHRVRTCSDYDESRSRRKPFIVDRIRLLNSEKRRRGCEKCGQKVTAEWPVFAFDFDHIDRETKRCVVSGLVGGAEDKLLEEMAKCRVLCWHCHKRVTDLQIGNYILDPLLVESAEVRADSNRDEPNPKRVRVDIQQVSIESTL